MAKVDLGKTADTGRLAFKKSKKRRLFERVKKEAKAVGKKARTEVRERRERRAEEKRVFKKAFKKERQRLLKRKGKIKARQKIIGPSRARRMVKDVVNQIGPVTLFEPAPRKKKRSGSFLEI